MKRALLGIALVALAASCSNSGSDGLTETSPALPDDLPLCSDLFQELKVIKADEFGQACKTEGDLLEVPRYVSFDCADETTLVWNQRAWGYIDGPMTLFRADAPVKLPTEVALECLKNTGSQFQDALQEQLDGTSDTSLPAGADQPGN